MYPICIYMFANTPYKVARWFSPVTIIDHYVSGHELIKVYYPARPWTMSCLTTASSCAIKIVYR